MRVVRAISELRSELSDRSDVGLVPTMGAFHEGHLELMRQAKGRCGTVVVSVFVNPIQFGPNEDFAKYPRQEERDAAMAESAGADLVFMPSAEEMYHGRVTEVRVPDVTEPWEGEHRPGHFAGVATVVLKLFNIVQPRIAFFGLKDLQQCAVIRRMVDDLDVPVELGFVEVVREPSGLALSSRNAYLSSEQRIQAALLNECLRGLGAAVRQRPEAFADAAPKALDAALSKLQAGGFSMDYLALVDFPGMQSLKAYDPCGRVIAAGRFGPVRLIDNVALE